LRKMIS